MYIHIHTIATRWDKVLSFPTALMELKDFMLRNKLYGKRQMLNDLTHIGYIKKESNELNKSQITSKENRLWPKGVKGNGRSNPTCWEIF